MNEATLPVAIVLHQQLGPSQEGLGGRSPARGGLPGAPGHVSSPPSRCLCWDRRAHRAGALSTAVGNVGSKPWLCGWGRSEQLAATDLGPPPGWGQGAAGETDGQSGGWALRPLSGSGAGGGGGQAAGRTLSRQKAGARGGGGTPRRRVGRAHSPRSEQRKHEGTRTPAWAADDGLRSLGGPEREAREDGRRRPAWSTPTPAGRLTTGPKRRRWEQR